MSRSLIAVLIVAVLSTFVVVSSAQELPKLVEGIWDLQVKSHSQSDKLQATIEEFFVKANFSKAPDGRVLGKLVDTTGEQDAELQIEWATQTSGEVFLINWNGVSFSSEAASDEEEGDNGLEGASLLFPFEFTNRTGGFYVAQDKFLTPGKGKEQKASFQWIVYKGNGFVFNVYAGEKVYTVTGAKAVETVTEQSFLGKFGMPILLIGTMILSRWLRPQVQQAARAQGQAAPAGGATAPAAGGNGGAKKNN